MGIKPGTAGWEARTLPLCYAVPPKVRLINNWAEHFIFKWLSSVTLWSAKNRLLGTSGSGCRRWNRKQISNLPTPVSVSAFPELSGSRGRIRWHGQMPRRTSRGFEAWKQVALLMVYMIWIGWRNIDPTTTTVLTFQSTIPTLGVLDNFSIEPRYKIS